MDLQCPFNLKASKYPAITLTSRALKVCRRLRSQNLCSFSVVILMKKRSQAEVRQEFVLDYAPSTNNSCANAAAYTYWVLLKLWIVFRCCLVATQFNSLHWSGSEITSYRLWNIRLDKMKTAVHMCLIFILLLDDFLNLYFDFWYRCYFDSVCTCENEISFRFPGN